MSPETLTPTECHLLLSKLHQGFGNPSKKRVALRNHTIGLLMLDAGLRVGEVTRLFQSDLIIACEPVSNLSITKVLAEKNCERTIPLSTRLHESIKQMYDLWWKNDASGFQRFAFFAFTSTSPLSSRQVQRIIKRASISSIGRAVHPHVLRHTFASALMRKTSLRVVQELLGHRNIQSTQVYTHPNQNDKVDAIRAIS